MSMAIVNKLYRKNFCGALDGVFCPLRCFDLLMYARRGAEFLTIANYCKCVTATKIMDVCSRCESSSSGSPFVHCEKCHCCVHLECLKSGRPSPIEGDIFFQFTCAGCSPSNVEQIQRIKLPWVTVVHLALYNLQLEGGSKCGFFKWKEHICTYIDRHWHNFFDCIRKKSMTWYGTVAGTLSNGSPKYFSSGASVLKQPGWWKLTVCKPPTMQSVVQFKSVSTKARAGKQTYKEPSTSVLEEPRSRPKISSIEAAIQRKAKRDSFKETKDLKKQKFLSDCSSYTESQQDVKTSVELQAEEACDKGGSIDKKQHLYSESVSALLGTVDSDSDIEIDPCSLSPLPTGGQETEEHGIDDVADLPHQNQASESWDEIMANFCAGNVPDVGNTVDVVIKPESEPESVVPEIAETVIIKQEPYSAGFPDEYDRENQNLLQVQSVFTTVVKKEETSPLFCEQSQSNALEDLRVNVSMSEPHPTTSCDTSQCQSDGETVSETDDTGSYSTEVSDTVKLQSRRRKRSSVASVRTPQQPKQRYAMLSVYEEKQLLKSLLSLESVATANKQACRLKRKLQLREIKRERGLPSFDLDAMMNKLVEQKSQLYGLQYTPTEEKVSDFKPLNPQSDVSPLDIRILDRFQTHQQVRMQNSGASFLNKLVGTEDDQLQSIHSPYTSRLLKPFIRRDYETVPLKLKLLMEIQAYAHRDTPDWKPANRLPVDYCYVRPQHIPTVNSYCREFFWPGIDMSECLHYPDFSSIAMYRKFVIGFAFMVPDVKHNEAYISFIFTHPEWRGAGIAKFMVYHLIQTCMGKDVTLHVSANNPAMLLYQKFGFKPEEFILNFYDKYFPLDSKESRHAFFLRLRR